jgi:hypothetical protein
MSNMEMVLALFAVVFFTSMALNYNQQVGKQQELLINATQYVQATQLCHTILDEVDAKLFSKQLAWSSVKSTYNNTSRTIDLNFPGDVYNLQITAVDSDSLGTPLTVAVPNNIFIRVRVVASTQGLKVPVTMQRIYTKTHLNVS